MDKDTRNEIQQATQQARKLLEKDFADQLAGDFDVHLSGEVAAKAGKHLSERQKFQRERIVAAIEHKRGAGLSAAEAVADYLRDAAFTTLNRFVALKMLEARDLVQQCITKGEQSSGYREFCGAAPGVNLLPDSAGYRLYIECLFDELSTEIKVLFDRRDPSSVLWPTRSTFEELLEILNAGSLQDVWGEDETIGWVYQFFNGQDERRKMREESQAPRNSRELAIRNQFFTPRYVVQFLTDNTLGRIWYEMRDTKTQLAEKCEYMVRKPDEIFAPRAKIDPRDIRVLDPACGSGHFLLYSFDLLLTIYEEAYGDPESPKSEVTDKTLTEGYATIDALRKAVPGLILAHNLHGVDIDARCAQIAQLALWMRAQKAYCDFGIGRTERPQIRRSNIVVAEPLVADEQIAKEFVAKVGDAELGRVFMSLVESLNLAGDLGLLLRVERLVKASQKQGELFAPSEERIRDALDRFVREESSAISTRRKLFVDDAAHGVALLGVAEKAFEVVLMNPPFGAGVERAKRDFERAYPRTKNDVYAAFIERGIELLSLNGRLGAITSRTGFFLSSYEDWRTEILLQTAPPVLFADLGHGVMDAAMVEAAAYCLTKGGDSQKTLFLRLLTSTDKGVALRRLAKNSFPDRNEVFEADPSAFRTLPGASFAYWLSSSLLGMYRTVPQFENVNEERVTKCGLGTLDDYRFLRLQWEINHSSGRWMPYFSGGSYSPLYEDFWLLTNWELAGKEIKTFVEQKVGSASRKVQGEGFYFRPGFVFPRRTKAFSPKFMPRGGIFSTAGQAGFLPETELASAIGLLCSSVCLRLLTVSQGTTPQDAGGTNPQFEVGHVKRLPWPAISQGVSVSLGLLAKRGWSLKRQLDSTNEGSRAFLLPSGLNGRTTKNHSERIELELQEIHKQIDEIAFALYGVVLEEREAINSSVRRSSAFEESSIEDGDQNCHEEASAEEVPGIEESDAVTSWLVGVAFGRFDARLATGERALPPEPDPLDPLPSRSPGMYPQGEEPSDRPDILVDDEGHPDDLATRARAIAERVKVDVPENLRTWLANDFFPLHIKMYSKSRRKAPIYWQLATPSACYSVWLYIHAFTKDTLFRVQNDYVVPKLALEERRLSSMALEYRDNATAAQRKELAKQEEFVAELRAFLDEVKRVAPMWNPNLDDGVIINFAPLWRLVPQHKPWQKELKSTWDELHDGKYDWAHLAMHLWPERVVPKCADDRSLAIAHGLEEVFWVEGTDGKWSKRKSPTKSIDDLVHERQSAAVRASLKSLLEAPMVGNGGRRRSRRAAG